ncbi:hypothetical protein EB796_006566 [Bugula neritina]|uniref:FYVE-type domain-containing protein n=1 Tax=Bugula neritina TaxID=10212 RepID=A0A7J7KAC4_BUGNE|nr:hypothetical protein EB796_006566 [Bugula neritina]
MCKFGLRYLVFSGKIFCAVLAHLFFSLLLLSFSSAIFMYIIVTQDDVDVERETYQATREGLEQMYSESQKRLKEEIRTRQELEKEVQLQISLRAETEMATRLLEKDVHEKQDLIIALRNQLDDVKGYNIEMHSKHQLLESKHKEKMTETKKLEEIIQAMKVEKEKVNNRLKQAVSDKDATEEAIKSISDQLTESDLKRNALETDLRIEKDWRTTTQENLEKSGDKINSLTKQIDRLTVVEQDYKNLKQAHEELTRIHKDQETALAEMAAQLGHSKMKHEDLREVQQALKDAHWADDDLVTECKSCEKSFNLSRRKHHCRNCGDIFCNECSDHRMMLPSSSKPVRVCDNCNLMLIDRASKA